ncbi:hypothetical protein Hdeb2414_s0013g00413371 [Helianthus debilis subsp. tardiflorus]
MHGVALFLLLMAYHGLTEQGSPIPKGYGMFTFPHLSMHPCLAYFGIAIDVVVNERKRSKCRVYNTQHIRNQQSSSPLFEIALEESSRGWGRRM